MLKINNQNELVEGKFMGKNIDKIIIGPDIKYILENCFNSCNNLKEITFEGNIDNIEAAAFMGCENLRIINANNINVIKDFAFYNCDNIIDFNIDENVANNIKFGSYNNSLSTYFKLPEIGMSFNDIPWHKIHLISKKGKAKNYFKVGDKKESTIDEYSYFDIYLDKTIIHPKTTYHVQILGFDHDDKSDGTGKAGITIGFKEVISKTHDMNSSGKNIGGWKDSEMRTYLNKTVHNSLSSDLQAVIKTVNKISDNGNKDTTTLNITEDKLFLLSLEEVGFTIDDTINFVPGQGTKYEYFTDNNSRIKKYLDEIIFSWWLRSAGTNYTNYFFYVHSNGDWNGYNANNGNGVVPAFCI